MQYFESQPMTAGSGLCSDDECPCSNTTIPRGQGYLYISRQCCDFRADCLTIRQAEQKLERMQRQSGSFMMFGSGIIAPVLCCEVGAQRRNLNMEIAAADARHWWATGKAPLRMTPAAGEQGAPYEPAGSSEDMGQVWFSFGALIVLGFLLYQCGGG